MTLGVSILVIMELALEVLAETQKKLKELVSILVIMELALEVSSHTLRNMNFGVSILVIMELALEEVTLLNTLYARIVSILVIMELALEGDGTNWTNLDTVCFNPCYYGIGFRRESEASRLSANTLFQSLLLWNWL